MNVEIDNSNCGDDCNLILSHKMKVKQMNKSRKCSETSTENTQTFVGPAAGQKTTFFAQFQVASQRRKPCSISRISHQHMYGMLSQQLPESMNRNTHHVAHYFEIYLSHKGTVFSKGSTERFYFQLIQPSLVPGVIDTAPPVFLDRNGLVIDFNAPVVQAPPPE